MTHKGIAKWLRKAVAQKDWLMVAQFADELYGHPARIVADDEVAVPRPVLSALITELSSALESGTIDEPEDVSTAKWAIAEAQAREARR